MDIWTDEKTVYPSTVCGGIIMFTHTKQRMNLCYIMTITHVFRNKIPTFNIVFTGSPNSCLIQEGKNKFRSLVDSGAEVSLIHRRVFR